MYLPIMAGVISKRSATALKLPARATSTKISMAVGGPFKLLVYKARRHYVWREKRLSIYWVETVRHWSLPG